MPHDFVLSVMARDRVGIVAAMTEAILELGGNIEAISQTVLEGYFTIIVTLHFEAGLDGEELLHSVRDKGLPGELEVSLKEREPSRPAPVVADAERFILTISGPDRKGIIFRVSSCLAGRRINIEDLWAYLEDGGFVLVAQLQVPPKVDVEGLQREVQELWPGGDLHVALQHENIFLATNHVDFRQGLP